MCVQLPAKASADMIRYLPGLSMLYIGLKHPGSVLAIQVRMYVLSTQIWLSIGSRFAVVLTAITSGWNLNTGGAVAGRSMRMSCLGSK